MDWLTLKSGSDVRGTAVGEGTVLTDDVARALGAAFVWKLSAEKGKKASEITVSLGRDSRISGPALLSAALKLRQPVTAAGVFSLSGQKKVAKSLPEKV